MKKINYKFILSSLIIAFAMAMSNIVFAQTFQIDQQKVIRQRIEQLVFDVNNYNIDEFMDVFSHKLYSLESKEGIRQSIIQRSSYYDVEYSIHIKEIRVDTHLAYEEGWYQNILTPKNGDDKIIQQFDYLDVWELENDGQWRIIKALKVERPVNEFKAITELADELATIAGTYKTDQVEVEVKVNLNNQPVLIVSGGNPILLEKNSTLEYDLKGVPGAKLVFELGSENIASKVILKQASGEIVAIRI